MNKLLCFIILCTFFLFFIGCFPTGKFHSLVDITLTNQSSCNVYFITRRIGEGEEMSETEHGIVFSGTSESYKRSSGYTYYMYCIEKDEKLIWGPQEIYIDFDKGYEWEISDLPTPTPEPTTEPSPTPTNLQTKPVADAGEDMASWIFFPTTLDGSGSYDPNGYPISYLWEFVSVPAESSLTNGNINNAENVTASFAADVRGFYTCSLTVSDGNEVDTDEVVVEIVNLVPYTNAGEDQVVSVGEEAFLEGSSSHAGIIDEGDTLTFAWEFVSIPGSSSLTNTDITNSGSTTPSFTPDVQGEFALQLTVDDGYDTDTDTVSVFGLNTGFGVINVTIE